MNKKFIQLILALIAFFCTVQSHGQSVFSDTSSAVFLHESNYKMVIDSNDQVKFDSPELDWRDVTGIHFVDHKFAPHAIFKFELINEGGSDREFLMHADIHWEEVKLYQNGKLIGVTGKTAKRSMKAIDDNFQMIPVKIKAKSKVELVFDVRSQVNYGTRILLMSPEYWLRNEMPARISLALFYGVLAILFLFNLIWYIITKEELRLAYCMYVFAMAFFSGKADNFMIYHLLPEQTWLLKYEYFLNKLVFALGFGFYIWTYLRRAKYMVESNWIKWLTIAYTAQYLAELLIIGTSYFYETLIVLVWCYVIVLGFINYSKHKEYLLTVALFFVALGVSTSMLQALNWRSFTSHFTIYATDYSFMVDALFFAIITAMKVRDSSKEKLNLQDKLIIQMKENELLQTKVNEELEGKVKERTEELDQKNLELESLNTKLKEQAEEIMLMNEKLDLKNYELSKENKAIKEKTLSGGLLSLDEVKEIYPDQQSCLLFLKGLKWSTGFECRKCGNESHQDLPNLKGKRCSKCGSVETITADTLFERIRIPLQKAFYIAYLVCQDREGVKPNVLAEELGVASKTCYNFVNKCSELSNTAWEDYVLRKKT